VSSLVRSLRFAAAPVVLLLACRVEYRSAGSTVAHEHPAGIALRLPERLDDGRRVEGVAVTRTADGFRVTLGPERAVRWPTTATMELRPAAAVAQRSAPRERSVDGRTIHYAVERDEDGGSCGGEETFRGWEACGDRVLVYEQVKSDECGGDFGFVWRVVEGAECPRPAAGR
jgi:hypothetical protein